MVGRPKIMVGELERLDETLKFQGVFRAQKLDI